MKTKQLLLVAVILFLTTAICGLKGTAQPLQNYRSQSQIPHLFSVANNFKSGDVNGDGAIDVADISAVISVMANGTNISFANADMNGDGNVDVADISTVIDIMAGKPVKSYTACPDDHHPHWIDLGLPSGTQWQCCNKGASSPEEYGGYYAFGQVASAPSLDQIKEFLNNTTSVWTTQNGVNGRKFTSKVNGVSVFLPAAGYVLYGESYNVGANGFFWSSTPYDAGSAGCYLYFGSGGAYWYYYDAAWCKGRSVRPVR